MQTVFVPILGKALTQHEVATHCDTAARLAALSGMQFAGIFDSSRHYDEPLYYVPNDTISTREARNLNIRCMRDLFGGVVRQGYMATKSISHPLVSPGAWAPEGWSTAFGQRIAGCVLKGYTAFTREDAVTAGSRLLTLGPVRIKPVRATAGRGQLSVRSRTELDAALDSMEPQEIRTYGLVLEEDLRDVTTFSVGRVEIGELVAAYYGTQSLTQDNNGESVYGGSELHVVRGGFEQLLDLPLPATVKTAVRHAAQYDAAALECLPGFFASRRNYDVAAGVDSHGHHRVGVLEQSWRIGGASSAEAAALELLHEQPDIQCVRAASIERYGADAPVPDNATVIFRGEDEQVGFISKYVTVQPDDDQKPIH